MPHWITYAVGDLHGRFDLLRQALSAMADHATSHRRDCRAVFLGDYVDRGPESRQVVETLIALEAAGDCICLKGNHEELMVEALTHARPGAYARWCANGGRETLASYGVDERSDPADIVPPEHVRWMARLPLMTRDAHRVFVHAGLSPRKDLDQQSEAACLWIREKFLRASARDFEHHIVHGHTPYWEGKPEPFEPELLAHRTNLDTAAFASGILAVGVFDDAVPGGPVEMLTVRGDPDAHYTSEEVQDRPEQRASAPEPPPSLLSRLRRRLRAGAD
jgi:serine/threonine protein phosphatase 1